MRCKVGDLCVIVADPHFNDIDVGKLVSVDSWDAAYAEWDCTSLSGLLMGVGGLCEVMGIQDHNLRPIRNQLGQDETLTWKELETA